jgi:hypothetical protein
MLRRHKNNSILILEIFICLNSILKSKIFDNNIILFDWVILQIINFTKLLEHFSVLFSFANPHNFQKFGLSFGVGAHHVFFVWDNDGVFVLRLVWKSLVIQQLLKQILRLFIIVVILEDFFLHIVILVLENWLLVLIVILLCSIWAPNELAILNVSWNHGIRIWHSFRGKGFEAIVYFAHVLVKLLATFGPGLLTLLLDGVLVRFGSS